MKELLYIPTGTIIRWRKVNSGDFDCVETYMSLGEIYISSKEFENVIFNINKGLYSHSFYNHNNLPNKSAREEFEIIDV